MMTLIAEPLTIETFREYGSIISPDEEISRLHSLRKDANQGTAIKLLQVSSVENGSSSKVPNWNLFRCFPQSHLKRAFLQESPQGVPHKIKVLEKHPCSSQTFVPMGRASTEVAYLVVVAKEIANKPDLSTLRAFTCLGGQAVTYGLGIWHAPMIVLGEQEHLDFAVLIYESLDPERPERDCVEEHYGDSGICITV
ncbi:hypothetical protein SKDZ_09G1940 [Saccharomyces kudriavzevii ZP591]|uniref:Uncharacterized protein n=3 Tax=Saccharomyces TaxID=4930 RepID=A0AA35JMC2_SACK1|nr:uncharacterized protein SKDI_09G1960 [Saccharomyces kudriavzevii IFO 1802]EHN01839.1 Dal3p [Saccharomyces cerevisiae x Saccharomyces kudriavzevii VIN7]EJT42153.1 DAL3-like protein [Saccharomyces kudriavzevii IFO 1802]CAI4065004.1 hypothetical protein SKDZ_09G1940 [Saccharomyces kudriavzevii ZP591]CAI4065023.1 hypothetical protein SKDI_09G1960 [Saccharomyces kudriavzevii IFO 1802]